MSKLTGQPMPLLRLAAILAAGSILATSQALAHAHLASAQPADKATVATPPQDIQLTFTEGLELKFSGADITGPAKSKVKTGAASLTQDGKGLTVPVSDTLSPGTYTVEWHVLSVDGHKSNGSTQFTVKP